MVGSDGLTVDEEDAASGAVFDWAALIQHAVAQDMWVVLVTGFGVRP